jgi:hypothetical protein
MESTGAMATEPCVETEIAPLDRIETSILSVMPLILPSPDDPRDADFQIAHKGLGAAVDQGLEDLKHGWKPDHDPSRHERFAFLVLTHALQEMANGFHALKALENTLTYGSMASDVLRTLCDMFARQRVIWDADSPAERLAGDVAEGVRQELLALDAAAELDIDLSQERAALGRVRDQLSGTPKPIVVANELQRLKEWEILGVFRWESSHVHFGHAAVAASGRSLMSSEGTKADVTMYPMSLWRAGQLVWALYGIGLRTLSFLSERLSIELVGLQKLDADLRNAVRKAALREKRADEPASPPYGRFEFSLWNPARE